MFVSLFLRESDHKFSIDEGIDSWDRMINRSWCVCHKKTRWNSWYHLMIWVLTTSLDLLKSCLLSGNLRKYIKEMQTLHQIKPSKSHILEPRSLPSNQFWRRWWCNQGYEEATKPQHSTHDFGYPPVKRGHFTPGCFFKGYGDEILSSYTRILSKKNTLTKGWVPCEPIFLTDSDGIEKLGTLCQDLSFVHERNQFLPFLHGNVGEKFPAASHKVTWGSWKKEGPNGSFFGVF